ncbi:MAG: mechanosensitive ion channel [Kofleriaceae bacterium]|nr:mechanosensitive ion channel [Kofleriaceae bacterium]
MTFWNALIDATWELRTPYLLAGLMLSVLFARLSAVALQPGAASGRGPTKTRTLRGATIFFTGHVIAVVVAAVLAASGTANLAAPLTALAFELLCIVALVTNIIFEITLPRLGLALPRILADIVTGILVVVAMIVVGKRAGFSVAGLITTSAVLTAVIGFALQDTLGNIMGGLALQMDNSVKAGDWITLGPGQPQGRVTDIRWRYTAIETRAWETIIIPNGVLMRSQVTILGRRTGEALQWRRTFDFFVDFRTPPAAITHAIDTALAVMPIEGIADEPRLHVLLSGYRDSVAQYTVRYWITDLARDDVLDSEIRVRLWYALRRADIAMAIPASAIFLTAESPERVARKSAVELQRRRQALHQVDLFRALAPDAVEQLATQMAYAPFATGETITREGDSADELYMVVEGQAAVVLGHGAAQREVARLGPGQFFGEMSLMTGEARAATVVAASQLTCYRIAKEAFQAVLRATPELAEPIAEVLAARREALSTARDERDDQKRERLDTAKYDLMKRIRGFFGIDGSER